MTQEARIKSESVPLTSYPQPRSVNSRGQQVAWLEMFRNLEEQHRRELEAQHLQHQNTLLQLQKSMEYELLKQQYLLQQRLLDHREILKKLPPHYHVRAEALMDTGLQDIEKTDYQGTRSGENASSRQKNDVFVGCFSQSGVNFRSPFPHKRYASFSSLYSLDKDEFSYPCSYTKSDIVTNLSPQIDDITRSPRPNKTVDTACSSCSQRRSDMVRSSCRHTRNNLVNNPRWHRRDETVNIPCQHTRNNLVNNPRWHRRDETVNITCQHTRNNLVNNQRWHRRDETVSMPCRHMKDTTVSSPCFHRRNDIFRSLCQHQRGFILGSPCQHIRDGVIEIERASLHIRNDVINSSCMSVGDDNASNLQPHKRDDMVGSTCGYSRDDNDISLQHKRDDIGNRSAKDKIIKSSHSKNNVVKKVSKSKVQRQENVRNSAFLYEGEGASSYPGSCSQVDIAFKPNLSSQDDTLPITPSGDDVLKMSINISQDEQVSESQAHKEGYKFRLAKNSQGSWLSKNYLEDGQLMNHYEGARSRNHCQGGQSSSEEEIGLSQSHNKEGHSCRASPRSVNVSTNCSSFITLQGVPLSLKNPPPFTHCFRHSSDNYPRKELTNPVSISVSASRKLSTDQPGIEEGSKVSDHQVAQINGKLQIGVPIQRGKLGNSRQ